jgi:hypothetical protein
MFSFEISNHYEVYYNNKNKDDLVGKKKYSDFIKSLLLKFMDISEGLYNEMTFEEFSKMEFYEPKDLTKEVLVKRFEKST